MRRRYALQKKGQSKASPKSEELAPRPFAAQAKPEAAELVPETQNLNSNPADFSILEPQGEHSALLSQRESLPVQPKLTIGAPGDKYEQEADRVAKQVVQQLSGVPEGRSHPQQSVQRESLPDEDELQMKPLLQRQSLPDEDELQMKPAPSEAIMGGDASVELESAINSAKGSGQPLESKLQNKMGQLMGADFRSVNVHTDTHADQLNRSIQAKAFTTGQDIFFRQGAYQPNSRGGQELIAHELTHVVQQTVMRKGESAETANRVLQRQTWKDTVDGNQIQNVTKVSPNKPVWKVDYQDGTSVIIKFETVNTTAELGRFEGTRDVFNVGMKSKSAMGGRPCQRNEIIDAMKALQLQGRSTEGSRSLLLQASTSPSEVFVNEYVRGVYDLDFDSNAANVTRPDGTPDYQGYSQNKHQEVRNLLIDETNLKDLGRMIYIDTLIGSGDRLGLVQINLENITFKTADKGNGKRLVALDNFDPTATLDELQMPSGRVMKTEKQKALEKLYGANRKTYAAQMLGVLLGKLGEIGANSPQYIENYHKSHLKYLLTGMKEAEKTLSKKLAGMIAEAQQGTEAYSQDKADYLNEIYRRVQEAESS